jgi:hypothetical protein
MTVEVKKYTLEQVESLEVAPGAARENLEGWKPSLATEADLRDALDKAFDYRGDVTLTLKSGERIEAYIFNRQAAATLLDSWVQYYVPGDAVKHRVSYALITGIEFTGKDYAAGKRWEDWVKHYNERKAAGETNIALAPEALE